MTLCMHGAVIYRRSYGILESHRCLCGGLPFDGLDISFETQEFLSRANFVHSSRGGVRSVNLLLKLEEIAADGLSRTLQIFAWALIYGVQGEDLPFTLSIGEDRCMATGLPLLPPGELHRLFGLLGYIWHSRIEESDFEFSRGWIREKDHFD